MMEARHGWGRVGWLVVLLALTMAGAISARAEDVSETCLACHGDKSMTTTRGGRTVSLYVDGKRFGGSVHAGLSCTGCHADLEGKELPHEAGLKKVNCGTCHSDEFEQHSKSLHGGR